MKLVKVVIIVMVFGIIYFVPCVLVGRLHDKLHSTESLSALIYSSFLFAVLAIGLSHFFSNWFDSKLKQTCCKTQRIILNQQK